jgi:hypothetical protein
MADNVLYGSGYLLAELRNITLLLGKAIVSVLSTFLPSDSGTGGKRLVACAVRLLPACLSNRRTQLAGNLSPHVLGA